MEHNKLMKSTTKLPAFVEDAYNSIEKMTAFANLILESKLAPDHLYEKNTDGKPDYTKGKTSAVVMILLQGHQLELPPLTALQHIIPINGLLSLRGDSAKSLIFRSGVLKKDSWKEEFSGSIENEDYEFKIASTRLDNGITTVSTFSVEDAKKAGLWITKAKTEGSDGWKYKTSAWFKYPKRLIYYRCLGFHSRDGYIDVIAGLYTFEEAQDIPQDTQVVIETVKGDKVVIPNQEFVQERSETLTSKVSRKIEEQGKSGLYIRTQTQQNLIDASIKQSASGSGEELIDEDEAQVSSVPYTEEELTKMGHGIYEFVIKNFPQLIDRLNSLPGKISNKKFRLGVLACQEGRFDEYIAGMKYDPFGRAEVVLREETVVEDDPMKRGEMAAEEATANRETDNNESQEKQVKDIPADQKEFEQMMGKDEEVKEQVQPEPEKAINHHGILISPLPESKTRPFPDMRNIFHGLNSLGVTEDKYVELSKEIVDEETGEIFKGLEEFAKHATLAQVKKLIDLFLENK